MQLLFSKETNRTADIQNEQRYALLSNGKYVRVAEIIFYTPEGELIQSKSGAPYCLYNTETIHNYKRQWETVVLPSRIKERRKEKFDGESFAILKVGKYSMGERQAYIYIPISLIGDFRYVEVRRLFEPTLVHVEKFLVSGEMAFLVDFWDERDFETFKKNLIGSIMQAETMKELKEIGKSIPYS